MLSISDFTANVKQYINNNIYTKTEFKKNLITYPLKYIRMFRC